MQFTTTFLTAGFALGGLLDAGQPKVLDNGVLSSLRAEASRKHPAASAARLRAGAAARDIGAVRLWEDPTVGLSLMAAESVKRADDGDIRLSFEQQLPKRGLLEANLSKVDALHRAEVENLRSSTLEIGRAAARDAIELALADESISLQGTQLDWLSKITANSRQIALDPASNSIDTLRLEGELARETQILEAAKRSRESFARSLNLRLGRPLDSPWPEMRLPTAPPPVPIAKAEIARIPRLNPKVRSLREMAAAAGAETRIADRERQPQFSLDVETGLYSGGDVRDVSAGLKMTLPYFNRGSYTAKIEASRLREEAAIQDIEAARLEAASEVLSAVTQALNAANQARAYSGEIYQRTFQTADVVQGSWISSKSSLTDLLAANRALFSIRLEQRRFIAMQLAALEDLYLLVPLQD